MTSYVWELYRNGEHVDTCKASGMGEAWDKFGDLWDLSDLDDRYVVEQGFRDE